MFRKMGRKKTTIGFVEEVIIEGKTYQARIDTGAKTSSLHKDIVNKFDLGPKVGEKTIRNAHGKTKRKVIEADITIKGRILKRVKFTVANRSNLKYPVLIGRNIIKQDFIINPEANT